jgi:cell division protein FtsL
MDEDYEQMNTSLNDDKIFFRTKKRNTYHEIVKNKNKFCKYCVIFGSLIFMIILSIFLVTKSSQLTLLKAQNNKLKDELSVINSREYNLKEEYSKLNYEKTSLTKENENLNYEIQFEKKKRIK